MRNEADFVARYLAVLVLFPAVTKLAFEELSARRERVAVDNVVDVVLIAQQRELVLLALASGSGVDVAHRSSVAAGVRRR